MLKGATGMPLSHLFLSLLFLQTPQPGSVAGVVTNAVTGGPVRKARVTLRSSGNSYTATTDAEGRFRMTDVTPGTYSAVTECTGYRGLPGSEPVRVAPDQRVENVAFALTPNGVITGRVIDENGDPMAQISVQAQMENFGRRGRTLSATGVAFSDDRGVYRFFDLPAGRYFLVAFDPSRSGSPNGRLHTDAIETAYAATWFPAVTEGSQAAASELAPGAELSGMDIRMRKVRVYHIRGKAVAPGSQQRLESPVNLVSCESATGQFLYAPILKDGSFDAADIPAGVWCAVINQAADNGRRWYARQSITVTDRDVNNVLLTVTPTAEVRGQVLVDGAAPTKHPPMPVQLEPLETGGVTVSSGIRPDGGFTIPGGPPGSYRVTLNVPGMYLKAVRFNGQDVADGRIQLAASGGQLTLLLATDGGEISGTVQGAAAWVTATSPASLSGGPGVAPVGPGGNFTLRNLAPGEYQVAAWDTHDFGLLQYAEFRKLFDSQAVTVTVHSKGRESVPVNAIPAAEIEAGKARLR